MICDRRLLASFSIDHAKVRTMAPSPEIDARLSALGLRAADIDERFVRGSGPGGQKINKTSSTVWLRHRPTGIEVRCQAGRSQAANRIIAWTALCDRFEAQVGAVRAEARRLREIERRRTRQKSRAQKARMVQAKKHRTKQKARRGRVREE